MTASPRCWSAAQSSPPTPPPDIRRNAERGREVAEAALRNVVRPRARGKPASALCRRLHVRAEVPAFTPLLMIGGVYLCYEGTGPVAIPAMSHAVSPLWRQIRSRLQLRGSRNRSAG